MNKILIAVFGFACLTCSYKGDGNPQETTTGVTDEYASVAIGDTLKGNYLSYSGLTKVENEPKAAVPIFIELVLDLDHRFAIRHRFPATKVGTDTMDFQFMGMLSNKASGHWMEVDQKVKLQFDEGTIEFFDLHKNHGKIEIINNKTALLDKAAETIWIWKTECRKKTDR